MTARHERSDGRETRERLLGAAEAEFAAKGYALASVREICARAGVNVSLANRYFGAKAALYRTVANRLFGELGKPMTNLADGVKDAASWRAAIRTWVEDFLFMAIPTEERQRLCAGLFRHEMTAPTVFHVEFSASFGSPIYNSLYELLNMACEQACEVELWAGIVWAQVSAFALADVRWHDCIRPAGMDVVEWRARTGDLICRSLFRSLKYRKGA